MRAPRRRNTPDGPDGQRRLRVALMGIRGIPANYGGFETAVQELAVRLVAEGHEATVYCRKPYAEWPDDTWRGVRLVTLPTIQNKYLDTPVHSVLSALHAVVRRYDVVWMFGVGNSPVCVLLRAGRVPVLLNVDGLDWQRDKWPPLAQWCLRSAERVAVRVAHRTITDSPHVQAYYREQRNAELAYIPYGAAPEITPPDGTLDAHGLRAREYFLYVGRLEPENHVHDVVAAAQAAGSQRPTVIVGDAPYANSYKRQLHAQASQQVRFTGALYGHAYWELNRHAYTYIFPVQSSGTHPALIEAMACGNCVLVRDTPDNRNVGGDAVRYYTRVEDLSDLMRWAEREPEAVQALGSRAAVRARTWYDWDQVTQAYIDLSREVLAEDRRW